MIIYEVYDGSEYDEETCPHDRSIFFVDFHSAIKEVRKYDEGTIERIMITRSNDQSWTKLICNVLNGVGYVNERKKMAIWNGTVLETNPEKDLQYMVEF